MICWSFLSLNSTLFSGFYSSISTSFLLKYVGFNWVFLLINSACCSFESLCHNGRSISLVTTLDVDLSRIFWKYRETSQSSFLVFTLDSMGNIVFISHRVHWGEKRLTNDILWKFVKTLTFQLFQIFHFLNESSHWLSNESSTLGFYSTWPFCYHSSDWDKKCL